MKRPDDGNTNILWRSTFITAPVRNWRESEVFVADDGSFCVALAERGHVAILKENRAVDFAGKDPFERWESLFNTPDAGIMDIDTVGDEPIFRRWNRDEDRWVAYSIRAEKEINATPELIARWNDSTRKSILDRLSRAQSEALRRRLGNVSSKLGELSKAAGGFIKGANLRDIDYQFLAIRKNPADREWFERLLKASSDSPLAAPWPANSLGMFRLSYNFPSSGDPYSYREISPAHVAADTLLAVFDGQITNKTGWGTRSQASYYLGRISGVVKFPTPLLKRAGQLHVLLIPESNVSKKWWLDDFDSIDAPIIPTGVDQADLTDEISFEFSAVASGKYFAKAIWDKRPPFTDSRAAGPGDYESIWTGPINLKKGAAITNVFLLCTNTVAGAEGYYAADRIRAHQWKETGELSIFNSGLNTWRSDIFSGPPPQWIIATNFEAPGAAFEVLRINVVAPLGGTPDVNHSYSDTRPLTVAWRRGIRPNGSTARDPAFIRILDEHGCSFAPSDTNSNSRVSIATFRKFPRSAQTWHLVGYGPGGKSDRLFDYIVTNRIRTEPLQLIARPLPIELDFGKVKMVVEKVVGEGATAWMEAAFFERGKKTDAWRIGGSTYAAGFHISDADGNEIDPADMCREQKVNRIFGYVAENVPKATQAFPFEFAIERLKPWSSPDP